MSDQSIQERDEMFQMLNAAFDDLSIKAASTCMTNSNEAKEPYFNQYCTQYACSLTRLHNDAGEYDNGSWWGRLIGFRYEFTSGGAKIGAPDPADPIGTETRIRQKLADQKVIELEVTNLVYTPVSDFNATVEGIVRIVKKGDGANDDVFATGKSYRFIHTLRRTWQAMKTEITAMP